MVQPEKSIQINFQKKRIFDHFRSKYDMQFDKGKKNMERYEYFCKMYPRDNDFFNQKGDEDVKAFVDICKKTEEISFEDKMIDEKEEKPKVRTLEVVMEKIIKCGKTVVGHFPNLDIGLMYDAFIGELPDKYEDFAMKLTKMFPYFFDTKILSRRLQNVIKSIKVDLGSLYRSIVKPKQLQPFANINFKYVEEYLKNQNSHDAGFDSYMTGCAFIAMLNCLFEVKKDLFDFAKAKEFNFMIYSRFTGEISLIGPRFTPKTKEFERRIVIFEGEKKTHEWKEVGKALSLYGTLNVAEDHGETYYVFDEETNVEKVIEMMPKLKLYKDRMILRARRMFK